MLRSWLLMASVLCVFMTSGCGKNETPIAANNPPTTSASPSAPSSYGGGESSESSAAGGSIPPGGSDSYGDGSSANPDGYGSGNQGNAGYPGNSAGYPGGGMAGSEEESNNYGSGYPGGANQGYGGPNQGQMGSGMPGQMGGNRGAARPNTPPPKPKKLTPKERATIAFEAGNMTRAYSLYHAHALSGDETQSSEVSEEMRWAARRPQLGLKVAVGLSLKNPANVASGSLRPLGTDYQTILGALAGAAGGGRGLGGGPGAGGGDELGMGGMVSSGGPGFNGMGSGMGTPDGAPLKGVRAKALADAAGTLAEKVIDSFRDELSSGAFTVAFKDYPMTARPGVKFLKGFGPNMGAPGMGQGMGNGMGYPGGEGMGYPGGEGMGYPGGDGMGYPGGTGSDNPGYGAGNSGYGDGGGMSTDGGGAPPGVPGGVRGGRQFFHFPQADEAGMPSRPSMPTAGAGSSAAPGRPMLGAPQGGSVPGSMPGQDPGGQGFSGESGQGFEGQGIEGQGYGEQGYGGQGFPGQGLGQNGPNQLPPPPNISKEVRPPEGVTPLAACLHYIGSDEQSKLIKKAYDEGYDALLVFEVVINQNRQTGVVNNATRVKAIFPAETQKEAKVIASSKELVNVTVAKAKMKNENDGVEEAANMLVKKLVEAIALKDIPEILTPEAVTGNRIPKLLKEEGLSKLEKMGEINFYYAKGFIDETQRDELYAKIAGKLAAQLMTGSEEEKEEAIDELLGD